MHTNLKIAIVLAAGLSGTAIVCTFIVQYYSPYQDCMRNAPPENGKFQNSIICQKGIAGLHGPSY